jgi:hypothetical protein
MNAPVPAGGKHALLIGISRYPHLKESEQLKGCVNDALQLKKVLEGRFGFPPAGTVLLCDEAATRDAILTALRELARKVGPEDIVVVAYSGHGSQTRIAEPTGWDESILPYDSGRGAYPNRDILDDEIHGWLLEMAAVTPNVTLIFDSCFSAGMARDLERDPFEEKGRQAPPDERPAPGARGRRSTEREASGWQALGDRYTLIAACRSQETAREIHLEKGKGETLHHGALIYFLCAELWRAGQNASSRDIFERVAARLTAEFPGQHPLLEGARDREPFGPRLFAPLRFLPVLSRQDNRAVLAGGAAHGVTVGSQWGIYPQGIHQVTARTAPLGRTRVLRVEAVTSEVEIEEEGGRRPLEPGDRAVEISHDHGEMRLTLQLSAPRSLAAPLADLRRRIAGSPLLRLAGPNERGNACVYAIAPRSAVRRGDPAPRLGAVRRPLWVVVGADGSLLAPVLRLREKGSQLRLVENLEILARCRLVQRIENPDRESRLRDKIEVTLLRKNDGAWVPAEADGGGLAAFRDGERFDVQIVNRTDGPVFIHVLDIGLSGRIELLYPVEGALDPLLPDRPLRIGEKRGSDHEVYIPQELPFDNPSGPMEGTLQIKVLSTLAETDFFPLLQSGTRKGLGGGEGPLELLLTDAVAGNQAREVRPAQNMSRDDWGAVTQSLSIRRE